MSGPTPGSVRAARELMNMVQEEVALSSEEARAMLRDHRWARGGQDTMPHHISRE